MQDLGRAGLGHLGVPRSGAADAASLRAANALVGNDDGAACLEATLGRLVLRLNCAATVALTGAPAPIRLTGQPAPDRAARPDAAQIPAAPHGTAVEIPGSADRAPAWQLRPPGCAVTWPSTAALTCRMGAGQPVGRPAVRPRPRPLL